MFQIQNLVALTVAARMLGHQPALMMNLDSRWQHTHSRFKTCSQRRRVEVGSRLHAALFVHLPEMLFRQFKVFALQRLQVWLFKLKHFSAGLLAFADYSREIFPAAFQQRFIQCRQRRGLRYRDKMIATKEPGLAFNAALLVPFARRAKRSVELPMRAEGDETIGLFASATAKNFLDCARQVVVSQLMKDAAKITECILMRGEKSLLRSVQISLMKRRPAPHTAQLEELKPEPLSGQFHHRLVPIDLCLDGGIVGLRDEDFATRLAVGQIPKLHVLSHRALGDRMIGAFHTQPIVDAARSVALFARRLLILSQNLVDERAHRVQYRTVSLRRFAGRWKSVGKCLPHHPPMNAKFLGDAGDGTDTKFILASDLFKELHFVSPRHWGPP